MARNRDDDDDDVDVGKKPLSGIEGMYANQFILMVFLSVCCNSFCLVPLILSIVGFATATDEKAKNNAKICLIISAVMVVLMVIGNVITMMMGGMGGR